MGDEAVVERFADVLPIVAPGGLLVQVAQLGPHQAQAPALQAPDDLADEPSFDGVRLADDQGALERFGSHKGARIAAGPAHRASEGQAQAGWAGLR